MNACGSKADYDVAFLYGAVVDYLRLVNDTPVE